MKGLAIIAFLALCLSTQAAINQTLYCLDHKTTLVLPSTRFRPSTSTIYTPGGCSCPNDCFERFGQGNCSADPFSSNATCVCQPGWKGPDCSVVTCGSVNPCKNGGKCVNNDGYEMCECAAGYNLMDCSGQDKKYDPIPQAVPGKQYVKDKYEDNHPLFDIGTVTQIRINVSAEQLDKVIIGGRGVIIPISALLIKNQRTSSFQTNATLALSGDYSRSFAKKSFRIRFEDKWHKQKSIKLKGAEFDASFQREAVTQALLRSMNVPVGRAGYAAVYINDMFRGVYVMLEEVYKKPFLESRFGNKDGAFCKDSTCEPASASLRYDISRACSNISMTIDELRKIFDVSIYLRSVAVDAIGYLWDGWSKPHNTLTYKNGDIIVPFRQDLDAAWGFYYYPIGNVNVYDFFNGTGYSVCSMIPRDISARKEYTGYMKQILELIKPAGPIQKFARDMHEMLLPFGVQDRWHQLDWQFSPQDFVDSLDKPAPLTQGLLTYMTDVYNGVSVQVASG